jgi:hypothetical protein
MPVYCTHCGARAAEHFRFCQSCGAPLARGSAQADLRGAARGTQRFSPIFVAGLSIGVVAVLIAAAIAITDATGSSGTHLGPLVTPTTITLITGTPVPNTTAGPVATSLAPATDTPEAQGPVDTPSTDGPHVITIEDSLSFDDQSPNTTSEPKTVTLSNEGGSAQPLGTPAIDGANADAFAVSNNLCGDSLDSVTRCDVEVTFAPTSEGTFSATLEIVDPSGNSIAAVTLSGTGGSSNPTGDISVSPGTLEIDTQAGITAYQSISVDNNGSAAINVTETLDDGSGVFSTASTCNGQIDAGTTCTESIGLDPPDQCEDAGYSGSVTFADDAGDTLGTVSLAGTATGDSNQCEATPSDNGASHQPMAPLHAATPHAGG